MPPRRGARTTPPPALIIRLMGNAMTLLIRDEQIGRFGRQRRSHDPLCRASLYTRRPVRAKMLGIRQRLVLSSPRIESQSEDFLSRKLLAERHTAVSAGAVRLKRPLCKVETDDVNLFHGCPLRSWDAQTSPPWHIVMPSGGGIHSINHFRDGTGGLSRSARQQIARTGGLAQA